MLVFLRVGQGGESVGTSRSCGGSLACGCWLGASTAFRPSQAQNSPWGACQGHSDGQSRRGQTLRPLCPAAQTPFGTDGPGPQPLGRSREGWLIPAASPLEELPPHPRSHPTQGYWGLAPPPQLRTSNSHPPRASRDCPTATLLPLPNPASFPRGLDPESIH